MATQRWAEDCSTVLLATAITRNYLKEQPQQNGSCLGIVGGKRQEEILGQCRSLHYLDCDNGSHVYIHMSTLTKLYTLNMCCLLYISYASIKLLKWFYSLFPDYLEHLIFIHLLCLFSCELSVSLLIFILGCLFSIKCSVSSIINISSWSINLCLKSSQGPSLCSMSEMISGGHNPLGTPSTCLSQNNLASLI